LRQQNPKHDMSPEMKSTDPACAAGEAEVSPWPEANGMAEPLPQALEQRMTLLASLGNLLRAEMPGPIVDARGRAHADAGVPSSRGGAFLNGVPPVDGAANHVPGKVPDLTRSGPRDLLTAPAVQGSSRLADGQDAEGGAGAPLVLVVEEGEGSILGRVTVLEAPTEEAFIEASRDWLLGPAKSSATPRAQQAASTAPLRRQRRSRAASELLRAEDVARILPLSVRQIQDMAAEGSLPGMKVPGCDVWMFEEAAIRALLVKRSEVVEAKGQTPSCRRSPTRSAIPIAISSFATASGTSATSSVAAASSSPLGRLMSARRGRSATRS
jgi:hypothetical protein